MLPIRIINVFPLIMAIVLTGCGGPVAIGPGPSATTAVAPPATPTSVGEEVSAVANNEVTVYFSNGDATLTPVAAHQLDIAVRLFRDANPILMFTTGYSDQVGNEYSNLILSAKRAEAVKRGLVARGIPANRLVIRAYGASDIANRTDPAGQENRRVVVTWRLL